jgi:hypothetical protein
MLQPMHFHLLSEQVFRILFQPSGNVTRDAMFYLRKLEETGMKKLGLIAAALGAIVIAAPSIASAETVIIKKRGWHHDHRPHYGARAEYRHDRGWHRGHGSKTVIIKKHRY